MNRPSAAVSGWNRDCDGKCDGEIPRPYFDIGEQSKNRLLYPFLYSLIENHFSRESRLLDYGCGKGEFSSVLARQGHTVYCVDKSLTAIEYARDTLKGLPNVQIEVARNSSVPFLVSESLDGVCCTLVLMMVQTAQEVVGILREFRRCLKPSGKVVITVTHPCFRDVRFPSFSNDLPQDFRYDRSGLRYAVRLPLPDGRCYQLTDYHWNLTDYFMFVTKAGLTVLELHEPMRIISPASPWDVQWNKRITVPPYLILVCERRPSVM